MRSRAGGGLYLCKTRGGRDGEESEERSMAKYVDGFVVPVPKKRVDDYRRIARKAGKLWMEHGALEYKECVAEDVPPGKITSFPLSVKRKPSETVAFSWITYKSRTHRDRVNKKVMGDPRMQEFEVEDFPADMKRMIYGGFEVIVDL
jgi:uncharacterized protein YbaA (DUF1428 family)